jgi:hypothetical protein
MYIITYLYLIIMKKKFSPEDFLTRAEKVK